MAKLFKPKIIIYTLSDGSHRTPDGQRVTKDTPGASRTEGRTDKWYGRYTDKDGYQQRVPLAENKEIARKMLNKLVGDDALAGIGLTDPFEEHRDRPLTEHLEDYQRYLAAKGDGTSHVQKTFRRIQATLTGCQFVKTENLNAPAVVEFLASLRSQGHPQAPLDPKKQWYTKAELTAVLGVNPASVARMLLRDGLSAKGNGKARRYARATVAALQERLCRGRGVATCNHYLTAMKGFTRWLVRNGRMPADPLGHLSRQNADVDIRHARRALSEAEFQRFVEATAHGRPFRSLTGADRLVLYTLAANTGFRANELGSLTPASFSLQSDPPTVTVEAAYSKRRRKDVQPLRADVAKMMQGFIFTRPRTELLWPGSWTEDAAEMVRVDLAAAGIAYAKDGKLFDFHAVRGQFISMLAASGVHPKVAQVLARHSTISLTMDRYTHANILDVTGALDQLPPLTGALPKTDESTSAGKAQTRREAASA
jgi:integrase